MTELEQAREAMNAHMTATGMAWDSSESNGAISLVRFCERCGFDVGVVKHAVARDHGLLMEQEGIPYLLRPQALDYLHALIDAEGWDIATAVGPAPERVQRLYGLVTALAGDFDALVRLHHQTQRALVRAFNARTMN